MEFDKNKIKTKIAISKILEENDIVMENKMQKIFKAIATAIIGISLSTGVVFAGVKVYEKIWKEPQKAEFSNEITEEAKKENMSEEEAKRTATDTLNKYGINSNIIKTDNYKMSPTSDIIVYAFTTEDNHSIEIHGQTGEWRGIYKKSSSEELNEKNEKYMTAEQAKEIANKYYKKFGFKDGEYEIVDIVSNHSSGKNKVDPGNYMRVVYYKKYGEALNPYESIMITTEAYNMDMCAFNVKRIPFENNEIVKTEQEAVDIVLKEDKKVETSKVKDVKTKLMIVKMNADAYDRLKDKDNYYKSIYTSDAKNYYKVDNRIRNAWVVVLTYDDNFENDTKKRYTQGQYSYFVDCTTGEIIGGHMMDFTTNGFLDAPYTS